MKSSSGQVEYLVRLVDDLLDVSRITSGKIKLQKEIVDLAAIVSRAVEGAGHSSTLGATLWR